MRIIVTGGNSGVGKATAAALAAAGHSVVIACRNVPKAEQAVEKMVGDVEVRPLDLADLASVRRFADTVDTVDVLVNNAGVLGLSLTRTGDGFEGHIGTNHLGHFALTCLLGNKISRPSDLGDQHPTHLRSRRPGRSELANAQVLEMGGLHAIKVGQRTLH